MPQTLRMSPSLTGKDGIEVTAGETCTFPPHSHSYYEMILYPKFSGSVTVNDTHFEADRPRAVLMTPTDLHSTCQSGEDSARYIKIAFTEDALGGYLRQTHTAATVAEIPDASVLRILFEEIAKPRPTEERIPLLRTIVLLLSEIGEEIPSSNRPSGDVLALAATAIINEEFQTKLTLKALAKRLNVSYQHLSECFSKSTGLTFSAYLCDVRLRHAKALLLSSEFTVTEISYLCGYENFSHFLRIFKKKSGVTPKEYRKRSTH